MYEKTPRKLTFENKKGSVDKIKEWLCFFFYLIFSTFLKFLNFGEVGVNTNLT